MEEMCPEIKELSKKVSVLFKDGEMVLEVYKGLSLEGYELRETFDSYGAEILEGLDKIVSLLEKKLENPILDVINECSDRMRQIDQLPNVFENHKKCLQTESMRIASKILLDLYDIIKCFAEQKGAPISELVDNNLLEKLENDSDELLLKAEPMFRKIDKFMVDLSLRDYANKQSILRRYSLKKEFDGIQKAFAPFLSFSINEEVNKLAEKLSEWLNECVTKLGRENTNIDSVVELSKSKIRKIESLASSVQKKFTKTRILPQGLELYFFVLGKLLNFARALAGK